MASLTPGILLKLLQSMNSDARVAGEHRSAVLQVTGIVPAAADLSPSLGFYLQLSDSLHSTYVSPSSPLDPDSLHLGQLLLLDRLLPSHPLPLALGLRPLPFPSRSPPPLFGSPQPLLALSSPSDPHAFVIQPADPDSPVPLPRPVFAPKENQSLPVPHPPPKRRFSSPAGPKLPVRKPERDPSPATGGSNSNKNLGSRPSSPALTTARSAPRSSSPVPSKCDVPSLVAAKEENRRVAREAAIVVPSRYRQPSPVGGRKAAGTSPMGRRGSVSPGGRRLSGGLKGSPAGGEGGGGKKKVGVVVAGFSRISDALMGSGRSVRKSWEDNSAGNSSGVSAEKKEKGGSKSSKVDQQAILRTQVAISQRLSDAKGEQSTSEESSDEKQPQRKIESSSVSEKSIRVGPKITIHDRKWTDGSIPFDTVSDNLAKLGKEAVQRRNIASVAAAEALEEALIAESTIRSLSMFSDLCSSSKAGNPLPTIDRFLSIYGDVDKWIAIAESLASTRSTNLANETTSIDRMKSASLWVEAALVTDLEVLSLFNNIAGNHSKQKFLENLQVSQVDTPRASLSKRTSVGPLGKNQAKAATNMWSRIAETLNFAKSLRREMQNWFLKFVEDALDVGFRLFGEVLENGKEASSKDNGRVAAVLSHLKRVNDWLDRVGRKPEEETMVLVEKIERLKRKIYGFVITHVGSAFDSSVSLSKA